jgi:hypothetical protein
MHILKMQPKLTGMAHLTLSTMAPAFLPNIITHHPRPCSLCSLAELPPICQVLSTTGHLLLLPFLSDMKCPY